MSYSPFSCCRGFPVNCEFQMSSGSVAISFCLSSGGRNSLTPAEIKRDLRTAVVLPHLHRALVTLPIT